MPPVVYDQAGALHEDAVTAWVLADEMSHVSTQLWVDHLHFLV